MNNVSSNRECRICHAKDFATLIDFGQRPITKRLLDSPAPKDEFLYPVSLHACKACGFVQILDVIPQEELYTNYELRSSWKPQPHIVTETETLINLGFLTSDSFVVEIGCNDGIALHLLKQSGIDTILGVEPSRDVARIAADKGFDVINDYFSEGLAAGIQSTRGSADCILCRQVLEHISYLDPFMTGVKTLLKRDKFVLFEVPDFAVPLEYGDVSAIWEEHVNYFTENSLKRLLARHGFAIRHVSRFNFSGGALCIVAQYTADPAPDHAVIDRDALHAVLQYPENIDAFLLKAMPVLHEGRKNDGKIAIYGAGNRTVILLNYALKDHVDFIVDDQPEKQNKFAPMCHMPILSPSELSRQNVKLCLLAVNAENEDAVVAKHESFTASGGRFLSLLSPSTRFIG